MESISAVNCNFFHNIPKYTVHTSCLNTHFSIPKTSLFYIFLDIFYPFSVISHSPFLLCHLCQEETSQNSHCMVIQSRHFHCNFYSNILSIIIQLMICIQSLPFHSPMYSNQKVKFLVVLLLPLPHYCIFNVFPHYAFHFLLSAVLSLQDTLFLISSLHISSLKYSYYLLGALHSLILIRLSHSFSKLYHPYLFFFIHMHHLFILRI